MILTFWTNLDRVISLKCWLWICPQDSLNAIPDIFNYPWSVDDTNNESFFQKNIDCCSGRAAYRKCQVSRSIVISLPLCSNVIPGRYLWFLAFKINLISISMFWLVSPKIFLEKSIDWFSGSALKTFQSSLPDKDDCYVMLCACCVVFTWWQHAGKMI